MLDDQYFNDDTDNDEGTEPTPLDFAIAHLAACRVEQMGAADDYAREAEAWKKTVAPFAERVEAAKTRTAQAEAAVRELALDAYHASGDQDKRPHAAVTVKVMRKLSTYDVTAATEWAKMNAPFALTVDADKFKKLAMDGEVPADIAEVKEVAQTAISADLSKWL